MKQHLPFFIMYTLFNDFVKLLFQWMWSIFTENIHFIGRYELHNKLYELSKYLTASTKQ